jgi:prepilin-type N-terminal cleavage/methylation domain-containing protein
MLLYKPGFSGKLKDTAGVTFTELLVTITVIAVLASYTYRAVFCMSL